MKRIAALLLLAATLGCDPRPQVQVFVDQRGEPGKTGYTYFVSYVYHTKENGPVAGYGYIVDGFGENDFDAMRGAALKHEIDQRKGWKRKETLRSLSLISVSKL
jgi:hypothetical protein